MATSVTTPTWGGSGGTLLPQLLVWTVTTSPYRPCKLPDVPLRDYTHLLLVLLSPDEQHRNL